MATEFQEKARQLPDAVEPAAAGVCLAPEAHAACLAFRFEGRPASQDGVARLSSQRGKRPGERPTRKATTP